MIWKVWYLDIMEAPDPNIGRTAVLINANNEAEAVSWARHNLTRFQLILGVQRQFV